MPASKGMAMFECGSSMSQVASAEQFLGRRLSHIGGFFPQASWSAVHESARGLSRFRNSGRTLSWGMPMLVNDGGTLPQGASGRYDSQYRQLAQEIVAAGAGRMHIRLGWEFNGDWFRWSALRDPNAFASFWRRIVNTMRSVPGGSGIKFDWNPGSGPSFVPLAAYPGDAYVSSIGMNVYDRTY
ncbi:MAG: hypothetical protein H0U89_11750, partial [Acidimicrobiia bacterium]|nr:hypothetical protein [Acidimicrobiia bacterium]